ncbi:MAG: ImmA/IrrE family metallo-endopeptidase [bacterium]
MRKRIPVNSNILRWARKTAGMQVADVAKKMKKDEATIISWESGDSTPTYVQLEKLAYKIYKRPLALFFFPEPPKEETPKHYFRTLPEYEIEMMSSQMLYLLRKARSMQINLADLNDKINPAKRNIIHELNFYPDTPVAKMVISVRKFLGINLSTQFTWKSIDEALGEWRHSLENHGVYIFKEAFKDEIFSGFCLYDKQFPIIYINNSKPKTRQIFSIFHELAHLLLGTGGVDTRIQDYINLLRGDDKKIEVLCNQFAGEFLVPDLDFSRRIANTKIDDSTINDLADQYKVSREVILRKFYNKSLIDQNYYSIKIQQWSDEGKKGLSGSGGNYYATKCAYLGKSYLELAFRRYYQNRISIDELADYLEVKVNNISGIESILLNKVGLE